MAISFQCGHCGRSYAMADRWAGSTVKCKNCGNTVTVPTAPADSVSSLDTDGVGCDQAEERGAIPLAASVQPDAAAQFDRALARTQAPTMKPAKSQNAHSGSESSGGKTAKKGVIGVLVVVALIGFRFYNRYQRNQARQQNQRAAATARGPQWSFPAARPKASDGQRPVASMMLTFSDPGPGTELEAGIRFHEVKIGSSASGPNRIPGHGGKLWLYLPSGNHRPKSLPCILIAAAGSNLITGMSLSDGDRPEHLPYVRAGFAVVAYELDGAISNPVSSQELHESVAAFSRTHAGVINAWVALEFATTRVPAVDPKRIIAAGHSSAATVALLAAENEPRVSACVAFAPAVDLTIKYNPQAQRELTRAVPVAAELFTSLNPRTGEERIRCPVFLFYADDDMPFAGQVRDLGERLAKAGKNVKVEHVSQGRHYESMIREGIPRAIQWLKTTPVRAG
jgi:dienelactone hydrolase